MEQKEKPKHGGAQPGAGRPKGVKNKRTLEFQKEVAAAGITPLEFMLRRMREPCPEGYDLARQVAHEERQFEAAKAAAPYVHSKLANIELTGKDGGSILVQALSDEALADKIAETLARLNERPATA